MDFSFNDKHIKLLYNNLCKLNKSPRSLRIVRYLEFLINSQGTRNVLYNTKQIHRLHIFLLNEIHFALM